MSFNSRRARMAAGSPSNSSTSQRTRAQSQPLQHIPFTSTISFTRGSISMRLLNNTPHHILLILTLSPYSSGLPLLSNTIIATTFHVMKGSVRFTTCLENSISAPTQGLDISKGSTISAPPTSFYGISNPFEEKAEVLCVYSPGGWSSCLE